MTLYLISKAPLNFVILAADKSKLTTATVEGSNVIAGQPELSKGTEYFDFALEQTGKRTRAYVPRSQMQKVIMG